MVISPYNRLFMSEAGFSGSENPRPILATDGLRSCIGFAGWESQRKIGFLVHFSGPDQVAHFSEDGVKILESMTEGKPSRFVCVLKGGCSRTKFSPLIIQAIKNMRLPSFLSFDIAQEEPLTREFVLRSLSLDTRTGVFGEYDPSSDPNPRYLTKDEELSYQDLFSLERLVFRQDTSYPNAIN